MAQRKHPVWPAGVYEVPGDPRHWYVLPRAITVRPGTGYLEPVVSVPKEARELASVVSLPGLQAAALVSAAVDGGTARDLVATAGALVALKAFGGQVGDAGIGQLVLRLETQARREPRSAPGAHGPRYQLHEQGSAGETRRVVLNRERWLELGEVVRAALETMHNQPPIRAEAESLARALVAAVRREIDKRGGEVALASVVFAALHLVEDARSATQRDLWERFVHLYEEQGDSSPP
jgi:hypothetical protein